MSKLTVFLVTLILTSLHLGCGRQDEVEPTATPVTATPTASTSETTDENVVALVDGKPIYKHNLRGRNINNAIMDEIFYQEGLRQGLDERYENKVGAFKKNLVMGGLVSQYLSGIPDLETVTEEDVEAYYNENIIKYQSVRAKELSTDDQKLAEQIKDRTEKGEDLETIGSELSIPVRTFMINAKEFQENYDTSIEKVEVGDVILSPEDGKYRIVSIALVKNIPLSVASTAINHTIKSKRKSDALNNYAEQIKKDNNVKIEIRKDGI